MSDSNKKVKISCGTILNNILNVVIYAVWASYYLKDWNKLASDTKSEYNSKILFCYMIVVFYCLYVHCKTLLINWRLLNQEMTKRELYEKHMLNNKIVMVVHSLADVASEIIMIMMVNIFIPFTSANCYEYSKAMCTYGRIGAFFGIILMITYAIIIPVLLCSLGCLCCASGGQMTFRSTISQARRNTVLNAVISNTTLKHLVIFDEECAICLSDGKEGDADFIELTCHHKFHSTCIRNWIQQGTNLNCPTCRAPINPSTIPNQSVSVNQSAPANPHINTQNIYIQPSAPPAPLPSTGKNLGYDSV